MIYLRAMDAPAHFIPDRDPPSFYPLRHYLRAFPETVATEYIGALTVPGDLVLDPFANTPTVARVAQKMGRRAIAVESNPLWAWLAHAMAHPPPASDINAALARLGDALKEGAALRTHISQMYATPCASCHALTPADYFIHTRGAGPLRRHYTCAHCGVTREDPATEDDLRRAQAFDAHGLHYHIAFERVVPADNLHADRIRKILDVYTPRNLDALVTLTQKIDTLFRSPREREILTLLLLHLLDRGTSFYTAPDTPANLAVHKQFIEFNLWREIEIAAHTLANHAPEPLGETVDSVADILTEDAPRAFYGRGSAKSLAKAVPDQCAALVLTPPPQRRLAFWALAYFWGAWTLGRAAVESLVASLDSHKNDPNWERNWYFESLAGSFEALAKMLRPNARAVFVFNENWQEVIETLLLTASGARLDLETFLFQPRLGDFPRREFDGTRGDYRIAFVARGAVPLKILAEPYLAKKMHAAALDAGRDILTRRGEPLPYAWVHHAAYARLAREGYLAQVLRANTKIPPGRFALIAVREGLAEGYAHDLDHYQAPEQFVWLRHIPTSGEAASAALAPPLVERVDNSVYEILHARQRIARNELEDLVYRQFPGDLTPEAGLIELCAQTYADERDGTWHWREQDYAAERERALELLTRLGEQLEYRVVRPPSTDNRPETSDRRPATDTHSGDPPLSLPLGKGEKVAVGGRFDLQWMIDGDIAHAFVWHERPRLEDFARMEIAPARGYILIPESRVPFLCAQTQRLPLLVNAFNEAGWDFVRAPFVEKLLEQEKLERHDAALMAGLVPVVAGERAQLELF